jgi:hypothetical protein
MGARPVPKRDNGSLVGLMLFISTFSGSTKISVLRSTLTCLEGSMLATRFSGRWDDSLEKDRGFNFFIDQPAELFVPMIQFLQCKVKETLQPAGFPLLSPDDFGGCSRQFRRFVDVVDYYRMTPVVLPPVINFFGLDDDSVRVSGHHDDARKAAFCELVPRPWDTRRIRAFEVTIGKISSLCIGWAPHRMKTSKGEDRSMTRNAGDPEDFFVGRELFSIGFNCVTSRMEYALPGQRQKRICTGMRAQSGDVVRFERNDFRFTWAVSGSTFTHLQGFASLAESDPAFSGVGTWWVTNIEY